jgi:hypothetical protein
MGCCDSKVDVTYGHTLSKDAIEWLGDVNEELDASLMDEKSNNDIKVTTPRQE